MLTEEISAVTNARQSTQLILPLSEAFCLIIFCLIVYKFPGKAIYLWENRF